MDLQKTYTLKIPLSIERKLLTTDKSSYLRSYFEVLARNKKSNPNPHEEKYLITYKIKPKTTTSLDDFEKYLNNIDSDIILCQIIQQGELKELELLPKTLKKKLEDHL